MSSESDDKSRETHGKGRRRPRQGPDEEMEDDPNSEQARQAQATVDQFSKDQEGDGDQARDTQREDVGADRRGREGETSTPEREIPERTDRSEERESPGRGGKAANQGNDDQKQRSTPDSSSEESAIASVMRTSTQVVAQVYGYEQQKTVDTVEEILSEIREGIEGEDED